MASFLLFGLSGSAANTGIVWRDSAQPAQPPVLMATAQNPCIAAGYPCFTPNPKDVGASSLLHTCGPVPDLFSCMDLGDACHFDYSMYTCALPLCPSNP